ncbi:MAG: DNA replication and repair protein RecF [Chlorobi bacterium]|nr:DNA replication and repair protein RecF [Chlorobiota bacterium]
MIIRQIQFVQFRNHATLTFEPENGINLVFGSNGTGKTSILEGIHYCCLTKGFISSYDVECVTSGSSFFVARGKFEADNGSKISVKISYSKDNGKQLSVNGSNISSFSEHIGTLPCLTFSPGDTAIVNGAPTERRRMLDNAICQTDSIYLESLIQYKRLLQQRNALLSNRNNQLIDLSMLDVLTEQLAYKAVTIVQTRQIFLQSIIPELVRMHGIISGGVQPTITYKCSFYNGDSTYFRKEIMLHLLLKYLKEKRNEEISRGQTAAGPHRDDIQFFMRERDVKKYASQGQKRTFIIALKLALYEYFKSKKEERPICLFDDIFSELDKERSGALLSIMKQYGQTIITSTERLHESYINAVNIYDISAKGKTS